MTVYTHSSLSSATIQNIAQACRKRKHCRKTVRTLWEHCGNTVSLGQFYWFDPGFVMWPVMSCLVFNSECGTEVFLSASRVRSYWEPSGSQPTAIWCYVILEACKDWVEGSGCGTLCGSVGSGSLLLRVHLLFWWVVLSKNTSEKGSNLFPKPTLRFSNVLLDPQPKDFQFTVIEDDTK